ncbi:MULTISPECIES: Rrf2 family transcriptional regulator [Lentimicrobium]|jgi:Rrf2 family protein|uniref:Transcriptional regulator, BadM/Rrf2 family n=1 Tax=Lentimicrobium saccharophilum TaxID=1678841 RepID=A0A0S7C1M1_9BACT|nr:MULTISPECIES: Rrf2 family transcriptional regulator [Lentimicrobium]GAP44711.1 transcriptional regulator, BadM/Rrf2 family [Lentimicrobium saccharophilum]HPF65656.1 Rrf2 family transcriptional regulator [Lentimicrobium sp.]HPJ63491.1 Rrf2 family transcriptional regulator [Lentimicrobium sp.]HPR26663.1 Rrf2 family transcriptional regulator [Lentimicrobium sp.]HRW70666.1 Rrf2 family transcriptional regulator [Lentimicrobium sp.]
MSKIITISEAASIAIHSMVLIAGAKDHLNVTQIAERMGSSRHHVAKILQRLVKEGYLSSNRGPAGGFTLKKPASDVSLMEIFETIEGKLSETSCPLDHPVCPFDKCLMGNIVTKMTREFRKYMEEQKLSDYIKH